MAQAQKRPHQEAEELLHRRELDAAETYLEKALTANMQDAHALALMGELLICRDDVVQGFAHYALAVQADPDNVAYKKRFMDISAFVPFGGYNPALEAVMNACLATPDLDCSGAQTLWICLLLTHPSFAPLYNAFTRPDLYPEGSMGPVEELADMTPLLLPLFRLGILQLTVCDVYFEQLVTAVRRFLLISAPEKMEDAARLALTEAVACYAFNTDYALYAGPEEETQVEQIKARLAAGNGSALDMALYACYAPLYGLGGAAAADVLEAAGCTYVAQHQIRAAHALEERKKSIQALTPIGEGNSAAVRTQYEEFPYPRWTDLGLRRGVIHEEPEKAFLKEPGKTALNAGCGTGREALFVGVKFPDIKVTAVDLSLSSLSYAMGKAEEFGVRNVDFYQADLLRLPETGLSFDFIASTGVLVCLDEPIEGLKILRDMLNPGGVMHLGFYSTMARRHFLVAQQAVQEHGYPGTAEGMRRFRKDMHRLVPREAYEWIIQNAPDFYTLSTCRDMLFHVKEHTHTLPQIDDLLNAVDMEFIRMAVQPDVQALYNQVFPDDPEGGTLAHWHALEEAHPDTFVEMYSFTCRQRV